ncbi:MAG: CRTAC1 family protein [Candidatus Omnitrophica bacterium]|nr:CRTAC1 family protein [Candidatus Omnitrophota bacterium]
MHIQRAGEELLHTLIYDNDGYLDLFIANAKRHDAPSVLFRNNGDGTFFDVSANAGLNIIDDTVKSSWIDYDNDGYMDLTIAFSKKSWDRGEICIYRNMQNGTFKKTMTFKGLIYAWGDYDNDGYYDLLVTIPPRTSIKGYKFNMLARIFRGSIKLYENKGNGEFVEVSSKTGFKNEMGGDKAVFFDYDNDGDIDIYMNTYDIEKDILIDTIFMNNGDKTFTNVTEKTGMIQEIRGKGCSAAYADYNNDGFLDLFLTNDKEMYIVWDPLKERRKGQNVLYKNRGSNNRWVKLKLIGTKSNREGLGVQITLYAGDKMQYRQATGGMEGYSQHSSVIHFGLGKAVRADRIEIAWPNKNKTVLTNVSANQMLAIKELARQ